VTEAAAYYDAIAHIYSDIYLRMEYYRLLYRKLGEVIDRYITPGMRVLDVGAGTGSGAYICGGGGPTWCRLTSPSNPSRRVDAARG